jgi:hypothetical protein
MTSTTLLNELRDELKNLFEKEDAPKFIPGEQFFRNYINDNAPDDMNDEDEFVNKNYDSFQNHLSQYEWVNVDKESQILINKLRIEEDIDLNLTDSGSEQKDNFDELDRVNLKDELDNDDIELVRMTLLDDELKYKFKEEISYKAAESADKVTSFTDDEKAGLWLKAAKFSTSDTKTIECFENAADLKAKLFKFEEAVGFIEKCIVIMEHRYSTKGTGLFLKIKNRINLIFSSKNTSMNELLRLSRKYRLLAEQAGLRDEASIGFVFEYDTIMQSQAWCGLRLLSVLYWLFAKYGESPLRVLLCSLFFIFSWAGIYDYLGISYNLSGTTPDLDDYFLNVYFSVVTFTTLGYGDFSPISYGRMIAATQALTGLFMTSLFLVTFVRRFSR